MEMGIRSFNIGEIIYIKGEEWVLIETEHKNG